MLTLQELPGATLVSLVRTVLGALFTVLCASLPAYCSSREDPALPARLQSVWNDNVACHIGWTYDMHLDINTQMNYWISEGGALHFKVTNRDSY